MMRFGRADRVWLAVSSCFPAGKTRPAQEAPSMSTTAVAPRVVHRSHRNGPPLRKGAMLTCLPLPSPASRSSRSPSPFHRVSGWLTPRTTSPVHEARCCPLGQAAPHFPHVVLTIPSRAAAMIPHNAGLSPPPLARRRHRGLSTERWHGHHASAQERPMSKSTA